MCLSFLFQTQQNSQTRSQKSAEKKQPGEGEGGENAQHWAYIWPQSKSQQLKGRKLYRVGLFRRAFDTIISVIFIDEIYIGFRIIKYILLLLPL